MLLMCSAGTGATLQADINGDRRVDIYDLSILAGEWLNREMDYGEETKLLLHFEGDLYDSGASAHEVTAVGEAAVSEADAKFGLGSVYVPGSVSQLQIASHEDFNFHGQDLTIEMWVSYTGYALRNYLFSSSGDSEHSFELSYNYRTSRMYLTVTNGDDTLSLQADEIEFLAATWYHIAVTREDDTWRLFVGGVLVASVDDSISTGDMSADMEIAVNGVGYFDEVRILNGVAAYTDDFTPPVEPFTLEMDIMTKAEIFKVVLRRLEGFDARIPDIDEELRSTVYDMASRAAFLKNTDTITTVDGTASYAVPDEFQWLQDIAVSGGNHLDEIGFDKYQELIENQTTILESEPLSYALWNDRFYFYPTPGTEYTINVFFSRYHPNSITSLEFGEQYRECVYSGVLKRLWEGQLAAHPRASEQLFKQTNLYESELNKRKKNLRTQPILTKYHDI